MPVKTTKSGVNETSARKIRRTNTLFRLQEQLKSGVKQPKGSVMAIDMIPLQDSDITRIKKEIETLKSRV
jgi:hypothetical protein